MIKLQLVVMLSLGLVSWCSAQIAMKTQMGQTVELKEDGTWEIVEKEEEDYPFAPRSAYLCEDLLEHQAYEGKKYVHLVQTLVISGNELDTGIGVSFIKNEDNITIVTFTVVGAGACVDKGSEITFQFVDGNQLNMTNDAEFNCNQKVVLFFGSIYGKKKALTNLETKPLSSIRIWTVDGVVEEILDEYESRIILTAMRCISRTDL